MARPLSAADGPFAHRGLWSPGGAPENSIPAFLAAVAAGYGIELDVHLSADGVAMVFHDPVLDRMTTASGPVWDRKADELTALPLAGTEARLPTLEAVLEALPAGAALLVELKAGPAAPDHFAREVTRLCDAAPQAIAVMSFQSDLNTALAEHYGGTRGVLVPPAASAGPKILRDRADRADEMSADYLAVWHRDAGDMARHSPLPRLAWTVDTAEAARALKGMADNIIFEGFDPTLV